MLQEAFAELRRYTAANTRRSEVFLGTLAKVQSGSQDLRRALLAHDPAAAEAAYTAVSQTCTSCHIKYRN